MTGQAKKVLKSVTINQAIPEQRIKTIIFRIWNYKKSSIFAQRYSFEFLSNTEETIAYIENMSDMEFKNSAKYKGYIKQDSQEQQCTLANDEIIVGVDIGVRSSSNIANLKFIMVKI